MLYRARAVPQHPPALAARPGRRQRGGGVYSPRFQVHGVVEFQNATVRQRRGQFICGWRCRTRGLLPPAPPPQLPVLTFRCAHEKMRCAWLWSHKQKSGSFPSCGMSPKQSPIPASREGRRHRLRAANKQAARQAAGAGRWTEQLTVWYHRGVGAAEDGTTRMGPNTRSPAPESTFVESAQMSPHRLDGACIVLDTALCF